MWQDITVCIIGIFVALYVGRQIYRLIKRPRQIQCGCGCKGCIFPNSQGFAIFANHSKKHEQ